MKLIKQTIGIDISKDSFVVRVGTIDPFQQMSISSWQEFENTKAGYRKFYTYAKKVRLKEVPQTFIMEATGVYYEGLAYSLKSKNAHVIVVLPTHANHYAKTLKIKSKTDAIDSKILTQLGLERHFDAWEPPSAFFRDLKQLTREHESLKKIKTNASNRLHAKHHSNAPLKSTVKRIKQEIALYKKQINEIEMSIKKLVQSDKDMWRKIQNILNVKGIGIITLAKVLAETGAFALVTNQKQLASYAGLDIVYNESGSHRGKTKISKKGARYLRSSVFMASLSAVQFNPTMKVFYNRLLENGKPKKVGLIAVARKLLLLIYTLWTNDALYEPNYNQ